MYNRQTHGYPENRRMGVWRKKKENEGIKKVGNKFSTLSRLSVFQ